MIISSWGVSAEKINILKNNTNINHVFDYDFGGAFITENNIIDEDYLKKHHEELYKLFDAMSDFDSKCHLMLFIAQKFTGLYYKSFSRNRQYFEPEIFTWSKNEIFIDCGAYRGENVIDFLNVLQKNNICTYKRIITFEADSNNYNVMCDNLKHISNIENYCLGVWDRKETLYFSNDGTTASHISDSGRKLDVVDIDSMIGNEKVTFIKMYIEGCELKALTGAAKTIKNNKPKLAICVYHCPEDLIAIPQFILSIRSDYKLYLRNYESNSSETVLYAI